MMSVRRAGKFAAVVAAGVMTLGGGLAVAGALPDLGGSSNGHGADVESVPATEASPVAFDHSQATNAPLGGAAGPGIDTPTTEEPSTDTPTTSVGAQSGGSRLDTLGNTVAPNVADNPVASAVVGALIDNTPGPGFGEHVAGAATSAAGQNPPPSTPDEASTGLSHRP